MCKSPFTIQYHFIVYAKALRIATCYFMSRDICDKFIEKQ